MVTVVKKTAEIPAAPEKIITIMLDVADHPTWQKEVQKIEVLEFDDQGRPLLTRVHVSAMGQVASYTMRYTYLDENRFESHLVEGDVMTRNDFTFAATAAEGGGSHVELSQEIDLRWPLPGFMIDQLAMKGVKDMLKALTAKAVIAN